jgi:hypothetical protein
MAKRLEDFKSTPMEFDQIKRTDGKGNYIIVRVRSLVFWQHIQKIAAQHGISVSNLVEEALMHYTNKLIDDREQKDGKK